MLALTGFKLFSERSTSPISHFEMIADSLSKYLSPNMAVLLERLLLQMAGRLPEFEAESRALEWVLNYTQEHWLRRQNAERWELPPAEDLDQSVLELLENSDLLQEPALACFEGGDVLLMSALEPVFLQRLEYFSGLVQQGLSYRRVFLLGGERRLDPQREAGAIRRLEPDAREIDMLADHARRLQASATHMSAINYIQCSTPYVIGAHGAERRPNTFDTALTWRDTFFDGGAVLCLTNQPFVDYQTAVVRAALGNSAKVYGAGPSVCLNEINPRIVLDSAARLLYTALPSKTL